ncbi:MAG: YIP1 family protein, partial [Oscillospiraceae bacterium]|nr:YIP1 family protein [Oscillospiraceae bacterium]
VRHTVLHPFEGFEDLRWKKGGTLKYTVIIIAALFFSLIANDRWCGFQFRPLPDALFSVVPYLMRSVVYFLAWVVGNWAVCTLLDGEGTMKNICIYSSYALIPYIISTFINVILSHILVREELVFFAAVYYIGLIWSGLLLFSAVKAVHQYSVTKTVMAVLLTLFAMLVILFLAVLLLSLFQKVYVFFYTLYTEILYRIRV